MTTTCAKCGRVHPGCGAHKKSTGDPCGKAPLRGQRVCAQHGGNAPRARAAAKTRLAEQEAARAVATLGLPVEISPTDALLQEVQWTAGHVQWLRAKVAELDVGADGADELVWGTTRVKEGGDDYGTTKEAKPSIWYVLYERERAHLVAVCTAALRAGVEERRVRLAEQQGDLVALAITRILEALDLTPEQQARVPDVVPVQLRLVAGGAA